MIGWIIALFLFSGSIASILSQYIYENRGETQVLLVTGFFAVGFFLFFGTVYSVYLWYREDKRNRQEVQRTGAITIENLALIKKYDAPDYETARLILKGSFKDYVTFQKAQQVGAKDIYQLRLVEQYNAPDYNTAKLAINSKFRDYETYQEAKKVGAETAEELFLVKKYQTKDYQAAEKLLLEDCKIDILSILHKNKMIKIKSFTKQYKGVGVTKSIIAKIIAMEGIQGIFTDN